MTTPGHMCEKCHRYPADLPDSVLCSGCWAEENGVADLTSDPSEEVQASLARAMTLLRCAEADLQGILPEFEPSGDRTHPAWKTLEEIGKFLKERSADESRFEDALEACKALVSAYKGGKRSGSIDWSDLDYAHDWALLAVGEDPS